MLAQIPNIKYTSPKEIVKCIDIRGSFSFLNINIRSLNKNFEKLEILLNRLNFSHTLICVTETWLTANKPFLYSLPNYDFVNKTGANQAGGTCIFVKSEIDYKIMPNLELNVPDCEDIWLKLSLSKYNIMVFGSVYRHPVYDFTYFQDKLLANIELLNYNNTKFLIGGDFNINLLNDNNIIQSYKDEIHSQGTIQLVKFPTRLSPINNNRSLLDHMYTNVSENKTTTKCLSYDISDHLPILTFIKSFQINSNKSTYRKILIRDLLHFNPEEFLQELES